MSEQKVLFTSEIELVPMRKGIYKDPVLDNAGFKFVVNKSNKKPYKRRKWGEDNDFDAVMENFGMTPGKPGEEVEQQLVFGFANVTLQEDGTAPFDWQGDVIDTDVLEAAAYNYVLNKGRVNQEHEWGTDCGWLVESMMFTKDKMAALGIPEGTVPEGWFVGFYIPDPVVYQKVKDGEYNFFSIEGTARRIPINGVDFGDTM